MFECCVPYQSKANQQRRHWNTKFTFKANTTTKEGYTLLLLNTSNLLALALQLSQIEKSLDKRGGVILNKFESLIIPQVS